MSLTNSDLTCKFTFNFERSDQGMLKGEVSLYHWPPIWMVWISLLCKLKQKLSVVIQLIPNKSNRRSTVLVILPSLVFPGRINRFRFRPHPHPTTKALTLLSTETDLRNPSYFCLAGLVAPTGLIMSIPGPGLEFFYAANWYWYNKILLDLQLPAILYPNIWGQGCSLP